MRVLSSLNEQLSGHVPLQLLRFESSALPAGTLTSLDDYIARMPPGQKDIYYLVAPHRGIAEESPYMEAFKGARKLVGGAGSTPAEADVVVAADAAAAAAVPSEAPSEPHVDDVEVLFLYASLDDFVMNNLREFSGRRLVTAETAELNPDTLKGLKPGGEAEPSPAAQNAEGKATSVPAGRLTEAQVAELGSWLVSTLPHRLSKVSKRHCRTCFACLPHRSAPRRCAQLIASHPRRLS